MPCSHCHQAGHNIRTCPVIKAAKSSPPLERTISEAPPPQCRFRESPPTLSDLSEQDKAFNALFYPRKLSVHFPENLIHSSTVIPENNTGKKVKHTPSRPRVRSGKPEAVLWTYFLASQSNSKAMNIVEQWKKYC